MSTCQGDSSHRAARLVDLSMQWPGLIEFDVSGMAFASFQRRPWHTAYQNGYMRVQTAPLYPADVPHAKHEQAAPHVMTVILVLRDTRSGCPYSFCETTPSLVVP
jgi:hypothetical protein